ncbi:alkaline phosphatase family protein [Streptomyces sp. NPDC057543]|uniref:alkaline phosphatase family protein n=1 Tax=Streptomyces sp. NPDC057543 TaxID=3346163 RepID=UPI0036B49BA2
MGSPEVPKPDHVVMVMMENKGYDDILNNPSTRPQDQVPYIKSLEAQGASFTESYGITHPSLPNYYAMLSASDIVKTSAFPPPSSVDTDNLPNQLVTHGYSFANYSDQAKPIQWLRYKNTPGTAANPNPMDKRQRDFPTTPDGFDKLPTVSFYSGNGQQSMHDGTLAQGDAFVKTFDSYIQWAKTHNSLFVLTWDEDDFSPVNRIPTIMVGPMAKAGEYNEHVNHYNVLKTLLDMYGLDHINHTADPNVSTITDAFDLSQTQRLQGMAGRCLENHQTNPAKPGKLGLWNCEEADNQQWIRHADGTIHQSDKCLTATAGGKTGLADCDGTPAQTWQPGTDGSLLNPASGRCLTVPGANVANGTPAELQNCDGKLHQKWYVPNYLAPHQLTLDAPSSIPAGSTVAMTTTYTNNTSPAVQQNVSFNLALPKGWTAQATSPATFPSIGINQSVQTTWSVTVPENFKPNPYKLSAQATYRGAYGTDIATAGITVPYPPGALWNNIGISDDNDMTTADLYGNGYSLSAQALASKGLTPGATVAHDGLNFTWPNAAPGDADNTIASGQTIPVTGSGAKLGFLYMSVGGATSGTGTITYTDGTTQSYTLSYADWVATSPTAGSDILTTLPYVNSSTGGLRTYTPNVYAVTVPLQAGKTVASVTLPNISAGIGLRVPTMHIFSTAIG